MKDKVSISIYKSTINEIDHIIQNSLFRNRSHFIEHAAKKLISEVKINE